MKEVWKKIPNYPKIYEASNLGRIRRLKYTELARFKSGVIRKTVKECKIISGEKTNPKGYKRVNINNAVRFVHSLIAEAFIGEKPKGFQVNHIDGNKINNCCKNLEYVTNQQNRDHAKINGLIACRQNGNMGKVKQSQINDIIEKRKLGVLQKEIALKYGVTQQTISKILIDSKG